MYPSTIRDRIKNKELLLSSSMFSREFHTAAAVYQTGPDWVWIDQEHSPWGTESIGSLCVMARQAGVAGVIRVPWNNPGDIKKAYDVGAVGVMVPQVDNADEARQAINYAKYPPLGERGIAPWFAGPMGIDAAEVISKANDETVLILQMESVEAYEKLDETLELENFEVLLVGIVKNELIPLLYFLSISMNGLVLKNTWIPPALEFWDRNFSHALAT